MTPRRRALLLQAQAILEARASLIGFAMFVQPEFDPTPRHIRELADGLEDIAAGRIDRLMVSMPPQHGKSWLSSQLFPAYIMAKNPGVRLATASYSADRAEKNSRDTRAIVRDAPFLQLFPKMKVDTSANRILGNYKRVDIDRTDEWSAGASTYKAVGVDGPLTGFALDGIVMDDLLKDWAEAQSATMRNRAWDWYRAVVTTRNPKWQVMVSTRWHPDDPSGRMLREEPDRWRVVDFPAIENEDTENEIPLWDCEKFGLENYRKIRKLVGRTMWSCLYQQRPTVSGGNVFRVAGVREVPAADFPAVRYVRAWDLASSVKQRTGDDPDWTVGVLGAVTYEQDPATGARLPHLWVRDVVMIRAEAPARNARIKATADQDGPGVSVVVEAFGAYKDAAAELRAALAGQRIVREIRPPGDKAAKAAPLEPMFDAGNVHVPAGAPWLRQWLQHFEEFPAGAHDDAVDATALVWHDQAAPRASLAMPGA